MSVVKKKKKSTWRPGKGPLLGKWPQSLEHWTLKSCLWNSADWRCLRCLPLLLLLWFSRSVMFDSLRPHGLQRPGFPVPQDTPEFAQTYVHWVGDAIQPSVLCLPLLSSSNFPLPFFFFFFTKSLLPWILQLLMHLSPLCCWRPLFLTALIILCLFPKCCCSSRLHPWQWSAVNLHAVSGKNFSTNINAYDSKFTSLIWSAHPDSRPCSSVSWMPPLNVPKYLSSTCPRQHIIHCSFPNPPLYLLILATDFNTAVWTRMLEIIMDFSFLSVQFSRSVMSDSLWPHESQHARPPCPSPAPGVHSNSRPSSRWCHPAISSSAIPFSSCPQSLPASGSFPMSQLFAWGGQSAGVSALASFLPKNTQGWSPLESPSSTPSLTNSQ